MDDAEIVEEPYKDQPEDDDDTEYLEDEEASDDDYPPDETEDARRRSARSSEPDVYLDVPTLNIEEIDLEVEDLRARVSLHAEVLDLLKLNVGADIALGRVELDMKGVEAQALLKVRLDNVLSVVERLLESVDRNPHILEHITSAARDIGEGAGKAVEGVGEGAGSAIEDIGGDAGNAIEGVAEGAGSVGEGIGESAGKAGNAAARSAKKLRKRAGDTAPKAARNTKGAADDIVGSARRTARSARKPPRADGDEELPRRRPARRRDRDESERPQRHKRSPQR